MSNQHHDILIIGAGLSGIGTACYFSKSFPGKSMAILERRERIGGTWDLFRYPGIRSDSDMLSFGYKFRLWSSRNVLADGPSIRQYLQDTAQEYGISEKIQYGLKIINADWSSQQRVWRLTAVHEPSGDTRFYTCKQLVCCTGYYNHDEGFLPEFPGEDNFKGTLVHPQHWPEDLNYTGKQVVVIGSGATAATLIPAMADSVDHITMLQRSPSYIYSLPAVDKLTSALSYIMPTRWANSLARKRNIALYRAVYIACRMWPKTMRKLLLSHVRKHVGPDVDMRHFTPKYMPWDERLCAVPDGDLFKTIKSGKASVETDHIQRFTEKGILLKSGKELKADIIIAATGLKLQMLGGMSVSIDGKEHPLGKQMTYKGVLMENTPNFSWIIGYTNISWTLKSTISAEYLCRLYKHMDDNNLEVVTPIDTDCNTTDGGILNLKSGYIQRDQHLLPRQGKEYPWKVFMHYGRDKKMLLNDPIEDSRLVFVARDEDSFKINLSNSNVSNQASHLP